MLRCSKSMSVYMDIDDKIDEAEFFYHVSAQRLEAGYGEEEPEYLAEMIKTHNPDYKNINCPK